jgi:hypothetical protein
MPNEKLVRQALKEKSPTLYRRLAESGELDEFVTTRAEEISDAVVSMTMEQRRKEKWDRLGPVECAEKLEVASALNREIVLAEMLEFPQDDPETDLEEEGPMDPFYQLHLDICALRREIDNLHERRLDETYSPSPDETASSQKKT